MEIFISHCASIFPGHGGVLALFFLGGLTGGLTYCLGMCGPMIACQRACTDKACGPTSHAATGLFYHLGRFTTYGALGFLAALFARPLATSAWWPAISSLMLAAAGALFLLSVFKSCGHAPHAASPRLAYGRGALLGFMPCGLLYAALMVAATLAHPLGGMLAMWLFALGTLPGLLAVHMAADLMTKRFQDFMQPLGKAMMAFSGLSLLFMASGIVR